MKLFFSIYFIEKGCDKKKQQPRIKTSYNKTLNSTNFIIPMSLIHCHRNTLECFKCPLYNGHINLAVICLIWTYFIVL